MNTNNEKTIEIYRAASWWLTWDDIIYPDKGVRDAVIKKARKFSEANIDCAIIFGAHCRWDFIFNWDRLHQLLRFIREELHKYGIKLIDHHSAVLFARPRNIEEQWNLFERNKHHVPVYPSPEMAANLTYNGSLLNDLRMVSVRTGKPCYLSTYESETFCMNNPQFQAAYVAYIRKLVAETKIDGLMCDDVIYYPGWDGCGCEHCRKKFKEKYGNDLPAGDDMNFWGNYGSDAFRNWVEMRYNDSADFLGMVRDILGNSFPLFSCCAASSIKSLDRCALSFCSLQKSVNHGMLEMCSEIISPEGGYLARIPDIMLHNGITRKKRYPNIGLGYGYFPDTAFLVWAFNKLVGASSWISTLTGRLGLGEEERKQLPGEADIIKDVYAFEKNHSALFMGNSAAKIGLYFSFNTMKFSGDTTQDYTDSYGNTVMKLFERNVQFDVIDTIEQAKDYPVLLLVDVSCLTDDECEKIELYVAGGGNVLACGAIGFKNERGELREKSLLSMFDIHANWLDVDRSITAEQFFGQWPLQRQGTELANIKFGNEIVANEKWLEVKHRQGTFTWRGKRPLDMDAAVDFVKKVEGVEDGKLFEIELSHDWLWRIYHDNGKTFVHVLSNRIEGVDDPELVDKMTSRKVLHSLKYNSNNDKCVIHTSASSASMYSPDLAEKRSCTMSENKIYFDLSGISRYFILELQN